MLIAPNVIEVKGGFFVTFQGTANKCAYWEVVGVQGASEVVGVGSLVQSITVNDINGFSVNQYVASTDSLDAGKVERIKVSESA